MEVPGQVSFHQGQSRLHSERQSQNKKSTAKEQPGVPEIGAEWKRARETKLVPHFSVQSATLFLLQLLSPYTHPQFLHR